MFGRHENVSTLTAELAEVDAQISAHPLASRRIRAAQAEVASSESRDAAEIDGELAADGLPSVEELGRAHVSGTWSWWKLHRRKRRHEKRIERAAR
ncbi:hypothetical protein [Blastococcus montanus]|uniref:hypothetical protein n=1 Tax=Blastococcus montanus TaxID=3144973 RepID=UPI00320849D9